MSEVTKLQKGQVKLLEQTMKISEEIKELKKFFFELWKEEDYDDGTFRWPFDEHGNLLPNTDITRRLN